MKNKPFSVFSFIFTIFVFILALIPLTYNLIISFKDYKIISGIYGSPFTGISNYVKIFESGFFVRLFSNTLFQGILFAIFLFIIASAAGIMLSYIKNTFMRGIFVTFCLIPLFIPDAVYVSWFMMIPFKENPFMIKDQAMWFIPLIKAIKYSSVPILATAALFEIRHTRSMYISFQSAVCFSLFSLMFITRSDATITNLVHNPLTYEVTDNFNTYVYRSGFLESGLSYAAAVSLTGKFLSLLVAFLFFIPFRKVVSFLFGSENIESEYAFEKHGIFAPLIAVIVFLALSLIPYIIKGSNFLDFGSSNILRNPGAFLGTMPVYILLALVTASVNVFISYNVSCSLVCSNKMIQRITIVMVIILAIYTGSPLDIGKYLLYRQMGIFNTYFAVFFGHISAISCIWAFVTVAKARGVPSRTDYTKAVRNIILPLILIQSVIIFNNFYPSMIYISARNMHSPMLIFRELMLASGSQSMETDIFFSGIILSVIPVSILVFLKTCLSKSGLLSILSFANRK